jgi:hypothetical protein
MNECPHAVDGAGAELFEAIASGPRVGRVRPTLGAVRFPVIGIGQAVVPFAQLPVGLHGQAQCCCGGLDGLDRAPVRAGPHRRWAQSGQRVYQFIRLP